MDYILAILIGITLGLMGSGGSILTLPVLVYVKGMQVQHGIEDSMFIVGTVALAGMISYATKKEVAYLLALFVVIPSLLTVYITRKYLLPLIPDTLFNFWGLSISKNIFLMVLFACVMIAAAWMMLRNNNKMNHSITHTRRKQKVLAIISGAFVGLITGLVGAGGGFLIVPSLVNALGMDMRKAVGTSLQIIFINTWWGFFYDGVRENTDWPYLLFFSALAIIGMFIGVSISRKIKTTLLKKGFGIFIIVMGIFILVNQIWFQ